MYDIPYHLNNEDVCQSKKKCNNKTHASRYCRQGNGETKPRCYDNCETGKVVLIDILANLMFHRNLKTDVGPKCFQFRMFL